MISHLGLVRIRPFRREKMIPETRDKADGLKWTKMDADLVAGSDYMGANPGAMHGKDPKPPDGHHSRRAARRPPHTYAVADDQQVQDNEGVTEDQGPMTGRMKTEKGSNLTLKRGTSLTCWRSGGSQQNLWRGDLLPQGDVGPVGRGRRGGGRQRQQQQGGHQTAGSALHGGGLVIRVGGSGVGAAALGARLSVPGGRVGLHLAALSGRDRWRWVYTYLGRPVSQRHPSTAAPLHYRQPARR